ncbi:MAG: hypothetical protein U0694_03730 [Anaerolineae bacterium]
MVASVAVAQNDACPALVDQALSSAATACQTLGRNEVCYGYTQVQAFDAEGQTLADFAEVGDIAALQDIKRLVTFSLDTISEVWGIALLSLQANLPDTLPGQNVTIVAFGLTELHADNESMQAFRFVSSIGQSQCAEVPRDGLLIQSPSGAGTVNFTINGVEVAIGSTVLLRAVTETSLELSTLEGEAVVTAAGVSQTVSAGFGTTVEENRPPEGATPLLDATLATLPLDLLPEAIEAPDVGSEAPPEGDATETPTASVIPNSAALSFEQVIGIVVCSANGATVPVGTSFALRLGWFELELGVLTQYMTSATHTTTYDGQPLPLAATQGPRVYVNQDDQQGFRFDWFWYVAEALPGSHEVTWSDGQGTALTCIITGE